ncbi:MAG: 4Fe-4S binding protein [Anaerolineae bacterium]|nr:4Fe-4S binding protein [Anaerolineae bacterium]
MDHEPSPISFADEVRAIPGGEHLEMCYSCGTCVSRCMIQQRVERTYNPRRLIRKVAMGLDQDAFTDRTTWLCTACDLCYPACPQEIHISGVIGAVREIATQRGHDSPIKSAVVNEQTCVACGLCLEVCPYEAVQLVEASVVGRGRAITIARVDPNRCTACGLCAAGCRSTSIGLPDEFSNESLVGDLWEWMRSPWTEMTG